MKSMIFNDIVLEHGLLKGPFGSDLKKSLYVKKGIDTPKVWLQENILKKSNTVGDYYISKEYFDDKMHRYEVQENDFIVTCDGTLGEIYQLKNITCKGIISSSLLRIRLNPQIVDYDYFYYYFQSILKWKLIKKSNNSVLKHLPGINEIKDVEVILPDMLVQKKIGSILKSIDNQIILNNEMVQKLQVLGKMIFERFSLNVNNLVNIKDVCEIIWGQCPDGENILSEESNSTIKYASGAGDIDDGKISINPKAYTDNSRRVVEKYTVCVSVAGTVGKIALSQDKISIGRAMLGLYNKQKYGLIYFSLLKYIPIIQKQATGAIQKIINNNHLEIIYIPVLSFNQINFLNSIIEQCLNIEKKTEQLYSLKNKLLTLLINQQLR